MNIKFYLERKKSNLKKKTIWCYVREKGKGFYLNTKEKVDEDLWDKQSQRINLRKVKGFEAKNSAKEVNQILNAYEEKILQLAREVKFQNLNAPFEEILDSLKSHFHRIETGFFEVYEEFKLYQSTRISKGSLKKYDRLKILLEEFEKETNYKIKFDTINQRFHDKFLPYLLVEKKMVNNSAYKIISFLKAFMNWAVQRGITNNTAHTSFKSRTEETDIIFLTEEELLTLYNFKSDDEKLLRVRDLFCFQCFTGVRYGDLQNISRDDIRNGVWYLRTQKTREPLQIPLTNMAIMILHKYSDWPEPLPIISIQKANTYIKDLCKKAKIDSPIRTVKYRGNSVEEETVPKHHLIGTHTARRTFVCLSIQKGMPADVVMSITGHKTYRMMQKYLKIADTHKRDTMDKIWGTSLKLVQK